MIGWLFERIDLSSIKIRLLFGLIVVMLPLISLLIYSSQYAANVVRNQVAQSNQNLIRLYLRQIDQNFKDIETFMLNVSASDQNLLALERQEAADPDSYNLSKIWLLNKLSTYTIDNDSIDYFFVYSETNQDVMFAPGTSLEHDINSREENKRTISSYILDREIRNRSPNSSWHFIRVGEHDHYYLLRIIRSGTTYIGAIIDEQKLENPLAALDFGKGQAFFVSENQEPIKNARFLDSAAERLDFSYTPNSYRLTGSPETFLLVGEQSKKGGLGLVVMQPDSEVGMKSAIQQRIVIFTACGMLFIIVFLLFFIRKTILYPLNTLVRGMKKLSEGNLEIRIPPSRAAGEFTLMNTTFNTMASQIQELKIHIYEEKLNHQHAELKHLQLQINPHFFLNSLNIIYYLAQVKDFTLIKEMSQNLIHYFRFMFRSNSDFVTLQDEITHTKTYLRIQELRFPDHLSSKINVLAELLQYPVPPLVIQSFVENAIKHAQRLDHYLHIEIGAEAGGPGERDLVLTVKDSGQGFPDSVLVLLQNNMDLSHDEGEHIGIWNMKRRLDLLYHGRARLTFSNAYEGGAMVEIRLPLVHDTHTSVAGRKEGANVHIAYRR